MSTERLIDSSCPIRPFVPSDSPVPSASQGKKAESSKIPGIFKAQHQEMVKNGGLKGATEQNEMWQKKADELEKKVSPLSKKELSAVRFKRIGSAMKKLRWFSQFLLNNLIHPATSMYDSSQTKKANQLSSDVIEKYDNIMHAHNQMSTMKGYLNNPLYKMDYFIFFKKESSGKLEELEYGDRNQLENWGVNTSQLNEVIKNFSDKDLNDAEVIQEFRNACAECINDPEQKKTAKDLLEQTVLPFSDIQKITKAEIEKLKQEEQAGSSGKSSDAKTSGEQPISLKQLLNSLWKKDLLSAEDRKFITENQQLVMLRKDIDKFQGLVDSGQATRLNFYNSRYDQLDGAVIHPTGQQYDPTRRTLILVGGNATHYEQYADKAIEIANKYNINVVLYNGPGVVYSAGKERGTADAVDAFKGVFTQVVDQVGGDPNKVAVLGHSLGGGISAVGLGELAKEGILADNKKAGLYINYHSFSSLAETQASGFLGGAIRGVLGFLGIGNLNAARSLKNHKVANAAVIVTARGDAVINQGRLGKTLTKIKEKGGSVAQNFEYIKTEQRLHKKTEAETKLKGKEKAVLDKKRERLGARAHNDLDSLVTELPKKTDAKKASEQGEKIDAEKALEGGEKTDLKDKSETLGEQAHNEKDSPVNEPNKDENRNLHGFDAIQTKMTAWAKGG